MKTIKLFFLIVILCSNISFGQGEWVQYSKKEGLASTWVNDCLEDKQGNMWFATDKGLCKFDGEKIESFTKKSGLPHDRIMDLFKDKSGTIWFSIEPANTFSNEIAGPLLTDLTKRGNGWGRYDGNEMVALMNIKSSEYLWSHIANVNGEIWIGGISKENNKGVFLINYNGQQLNPIAQMGGKSFSSFDYFFSQGGKTSLIEHPKSESLTNRQITKYTFKGCDTIHYI